MGTRPCREMLILQRWAPEPTVTSPQPEDDNLLCSGQVCDVVILSVLALAILPGGVEAVPYDGTGFSVRYRVVSLIQLAALFGKSVRRLISVHTAVGGYPLQDQSCAGTKQLQLPPDVLQHLASAVATLQALEQRYLQSVRTTVDEASESGV